MNIVIAGDFCPRYRVAEQFEQNNFSIVLEAIKPIIGKADYSIVNLECPVCKGGEKPIDKIGPNLKCSEKGIKALKWAGFNCVTLANNHFYDYGEDGVFNTLTACKQNGIDYVGGGKNISEASQTLYKTIEYQTLAIINCCEHEFSIATETSGGSNPLNSIQQYYAIQEARKKADYILVIVHGGHEHYQLPSPRMKEVYHFFIDAGADAVINTHQHCMSGYEVYKNRPVFYGLGNFCFDSLTHVRDTWNEGILVNLDFSNEKYGFSIIPFAQCQETAIVNSLCLESKENILGKIKGINSIIQNDNELEQQYNDFIEKSKESVKLILEPYSNRWLLALYRRHLLPSFITKNKKILLLSYLQCESHIIKVLNYLKSK